MSDHHAIKAILLDLDDTLLRNDTEPFIQAYFESLTAHVASLCTPNQFMHALNMGTRAMLVNDGQDTTNREAFNDAFFRLLDCDHAALESFIMDYYKNAYENLQPLTSPMPGARALVSLCVASGLQVAIATQPVFPLVAVQARLRWANVGADEFAYDWVTSYETSRACKPHPQYFIDIATRLGCVPSECLMVGDSPDTDLPANRAGLKTFWIRGNQTDEALPNTPDAQGNLGTLIELVQAGKIHEL